MNETIRKTASTAAQAAVNSSHEPLPPAGFNLPARNALVSPQNQGELNSVAGNEDPAPPLIKLDRAVTTDSVQERPAKLMEFSKLSPKKVNSLRPTNDEPLTLTLDSSVIKVTKAKATSPIQGKGPLP